MTSKHLFLAGITALVLSACATPETEKLHILVGTYTEGTESQGVYLYNFDPSTLACELLDTAKAGNPSFIITSPDRTHAYAVNEFNDGRSGVSSFHLSDDSINPQNRRLGAGADPCNILLANGNIFTADYTGGTMSVFPIKESGSIAFKTDGFVPKFEDDVTSHIHCTALSPDGKYIFITNLGADAIHRATLSDKGRVPTGYVTAFRFTDGSHPGPRHMTFSPDGRFAYLISELGDCLSTFSYDDGELKHISTELAYDGEGHGSADIHITPDGRFLYTSHRLKEDGIAIFRLDPESGLPERTGYCRTGIHPRNFAITPDGKFLFCACRDSDRIEIYGINPDDGSLSFTGKTIELPAPVCIQIY